MKNVSKLCVSLLLASSAVPAADLVLRHSPDPEQVPPNMMITMDDSNSMRYEITFEDHYPAGTYLGVDAVNLIRDTRFKDAQHFYDGQRPYLAPLYDADGLYIEVSILDMPTLVREMDWRIRSADVNTSYYDPSRVYAPFPGFADADIKAVRLWPSSLKPEYNTTVNLESAGWSFFTGEDTAGWSDEPLQTKINITPNGLYDLWDDHVRYTLTSSGIRVTRMDYTPVAKVTDTTCDPLSSANAEDHYKICFNGVQSVLAWNNPFGRTVEQEKQNIANWFQYHRTRGLALISVMAGLFDTFPRFRYSLSSFQSYKPSQILAPTDLDYDSTAHNKAVLDSLLKLSFGPYGPGTTRQPTRTRNGVIDANEYFLDNSSGKSPLIKSCQQNFNLVVSDGLETDKAPVTGFGDADGDSVSESLGDIAYRYYFEDQRPDLPNNVAKVPTRCPNAKLTDHQSIRMLPVIFGFGSNLPIDSQGCWPPENGSGQIEWATPDPKDYLQEVGDVWLSAFNSAGIFTKAQDAQSLNYELYSLMLALYDQDRSAASAIVSAGFIDDMTQAFSSVYNLSERTGNLLAFQLSSDGADVDPSWNANSVIASKSFAGGGERHIYSYQGKEEKLHKLEPSTTFEANLSESQEDRLLQNGAPAVVKQQFSDWLLDEASKPLGTTVYSTPVVVGPSLLTVHPDLPEAAKFPTYQNQTQKRGKAVYIGTNDGFIHGFDADGGREYFKIIPDVFMQSDLLDPFSTRISRVNGKIHVDDAYLGKRGWRTVLISGFGDGATGLIALDVTKPDNFDVLWELSRDNNQNLPWFERQIGHLTSRPAIARLPDGRWYAVFGNGYNSLQQEAILLFVDLETGEPRRSVNTGFDNTDDPLNLDRNNGLSEPALVDTDGDGMVDRAYAGDFFGNLFAFDLSSKNARDWTSVYGTDRRAIPLYSEKGAPITTKPAVVVDTREGGVTERDYVVIFGTGEEILDIESTVNSPNALVAITDTGEVVSAVSELAEITVQKQGNKLVLGQDVMSGKKHWRISLSGSLDGYKMLNNPEVRFGEARFTLNKTILTDPCNSEEAQTAYLVVDALTGGASDEQVFTSDTDETENVVGVLIDSPLHNVLTVGTEKGEVLIGNQTTTGEVRATDRLPSKRGVGRRMWWRMVD